MKGGGGGGEGGNRGAYDRTKKTFCQNKLHKLEDCEGRPIPRLSQGTTSCKST